MSDYKRSAIQVRDQRHTKNPEEVGKHTNSKNTRKWCRGKEGVEHKLVCHIYSDIKGTPESSALYDLHREWRLLVCTVCGKELDYYYPHKNLNFSQNPKPTWVDK